MLGFAEEELLRAIVCNDKHIATFAESGRYAHEAG